MKTLTRAPKQKVLSDYVLNVKVPRALLARIDKDAAREGLTRVAVIRRMLLRTYGDAG